MKSALIRWLRLVAPPEWSIAGLLVICGMFELLYLWLEWLAGWQGAAPVELFRGRDFACILAAVFLGYYRVVAFHPQFDHAYLSWLWLTPWKANLPLPKGPLHLVPQDVAIVLLIMGLMYHHANFPLVLVPTGFLLGYYLALSLSLWSVDLRSLAYALSALAALIIRAIDFSPSVGLEVAVAVYGFAWFCVRWTLATFPWNARAAAWRKGAQQRRQALTTGHRDFATSVLESDAPELIAPWPYNRLHGRQRPSFFSRWDRVAVVLLISWWAYVLLSIPKDIGFVAGAGSMVYLGLLWGAVFVRLATYLSGYSSPLSLWGRLWTFRWIIPGYDHVFLTPLATLGLGGSVPVFLLWLQFPPVAVISLSLIPFLLCAALGGPSLVQWQLTSRSRIVPGIRTQQIFEEI